MVVLGWARGCRSAGCGVWSLRLYGSIRAFSRRSAWQGWSGGIPTARKRSTNSLQHLLSHQCPPLDMDHQRTDFVWGLRAASTTWTPNQDKGRPLLTPTVVHRRNVDGNQAAESCCICLEVLEIGEEMVMLLCECPYWTHEACLAKSVFETCRCPTCQTSVDLLDDKISIAPEAADGLMCKQEGVIIAHCENH